MCQLQQLLGVYLILDATVGFEEHDEDFEELEDLLGCQGFMRIFLSLQPSHKLIQIEIEESLVQQVGTTEAKPLEDCHKLSIINQPRMPVDILKYRIVKLLTQWCQLVLARPYLMWEVVEYHLDLDHVVS